MEVRGGPSTSHYFYSISCKGNFQACEKIRSFGDQWFSFYMFTASEYSTDFLFPAEIYFNG